MIILGLETSCDETAAAIVQHCPTADNPYAAKVLAENVYSQFDEHACYGGVVPEIASRAHAERLPAIVQKTLTDAALNINDIDAIAATTGPGLVGALLMGTTFGKTLALTADKPFLSTNHIEGHALTALLTEEHLRPPFMLLLVSGGHCQLVHVRAVGDYVTLGATLDDAIGECFDKVGKLLNFTHPAAPKVEIAAAKGDAAQVQLPLPKTAEPLDFSFSGLKTAVRTVLDKGDKNDADFINNVAAAFQQRAAQSLAQKTAAALKEVGNMPLVVSGGVAVNKEIRAALQTVSDTAGVPFYAPPLKLCADNAVMIAYTACLRAHFGEVKNDLDAKVRPRWPLEEMGL